MKESIINQHELMREAAEHWHKLLGEGPREFPLNLKLNDSDQGNILLAQINLSLDFDTHELLKQKASNELGILVMLLSALEIVLAHYVEQLPYWIAYPAMKPTGKDQQTQLLYARADYIPDSSYREGVLRNREQLINGLSYQYYPILHYLMDDLAENNLASIVIVLHTLHSHFLISEHIEKHPEALVIEYIEKEGVLQLHFNEARHERGYLQILLQGLNFSLKEGLTYPASSIREIAASLYENVWPNFEHSSSVNSQQVPNILREFEMKAKNSPEHPCLYYQDSYMTYGKLYDEVLQLAAGLRKMRVVPGDIVAVMTERSVESVCAIMAVWAVGAGYLPLDLKAPPERVRLILEEVSPKLIIGSDELTTISDGVVTNFENLLHLGKHYNLLTLTDPEPNCPAYIIYTSGTTGRPKGVKVNHGSINERIDWRSKEYGLTSKDTVLQLFPLYFDGFLTSFFTPLVSGASIVLCNEDEARDPNAFAHLIEKYEVTHFICIPTLFAHLQDVCTPAQLSSLRIVTLAGERITKNIIESAFSFPWLELVNEYGPTECTVAVTCKRRVVENRSIGKPIRNTDIYLMWDRGRVLPPGVYGEIWVGGRGLAEGYVGNATLNTQKFVPHPILSSGRMYRTGDIACWEGNGELEYSGRLDRQIKLHGNRIELDEIEFCLMKYPGVTNAAVLIVEPEERSPYIVAYYEGDLDTQNDKQLLSNFLSVHLPSYMIPSIIAPVAIMPLTAQGKMDYKYLAAMSIKTEMKREITDIEEVSNPVTKELRMIWSKVLKHEVVSIDSSFFELGGNSILASVMLHQLQDQGYGRIEYADFFKYSSIRKLSTRLHKHAEYDVIPEAKASEFYPVSPAQQRMYLLDKLYDAGTAYNMPGAVEVRGELDIEKLERCINEVIRHHEIFRTSLQRREGELVQYICDSVWIRIEVESIELDGLHEALTSFIQPFDLEKGPLIRAKIFQFNSVHSWLAYDMHHIISDAVTLEMLMTEWFSLYMEQDAPVMRSSRRVSYKDYTVWHSNRAHSKEMLEHKQYWLQQFQDEWPEPPQIFQSVNRRELEGGVPKQIRRIVQGELFDKIEQFTFNTNTTSFMLLMSVYQILLSKLANQQDIVVGSPVNIRNHPDILDTPGLFVNTLPLRSHPKGDKRFLDYLSEVKLKVLEMYEHSESPLEELVQAIAESTGRQGSYGNPFHTVFTYQNYAPQEMKSDQLTITPFPICPREAKFPYALEVWKGKELTLQLDYKDSLMDQEQAEQFMDRFIHLIKQVVELTEGTRIKDLTILTEEEWQYNLYTFNSTGIQWPFQCIHHWFADQVRKTPEAIAIVDGSDEMTYLEIDHQAGKLAAILHRFGVGREATVAISDDHGTPLVIGILGVLKAGAAYVPIDPLLPLERIEFMIKDSGSSILLTSEHYLERFRNLQCHQLDISESITNSDGLVYEEIDIQPDDLAYIIYTSGTTGQPKGTMISHNSLANYIGWSNQEYIRGDKIGFAFYSSISFDLTITSIFTPLISGNRIIVYKGENKAIVLRKIFEDNPHCVVKLTPSHLRILEGMDLSHTRIQRLIIGGEDLKCELAFQIHRASNGFIEIYNEYGPTEATVGCMIYRYDPKVGDRGSVPIGVPAANTGIYVLDENLSPVPKGSQGELYIFGVGVAKGYLHQPEITRSHFKPNPYLQNSVMYKTGDRVAVDRLGQLIYLGRMDNQVKIRGHRVELGEVQNVILEYPDIMDATVIDFKDNEELSLAAYYTSRQQGVTAKLKEYLQARMPAYMVPDFLIEIEVMPVNHNGKVNRHKLPPPERSQRSLSFNASVGLAEPYVQELLLLWKSLLYREEFGIEDSFFDVGGNSILALKLNDLIQRELTSHIRMTDIFAYPTVRQLASQLNARMVHPAITAGNLPNSTSLCLPEAYYHDLISDDYIEKSRYSVQLTEMQQQSLKRYMNSSNGQPEHLLIAVYIYSLVQLSGQYQFTVPVVQGEIVKLLTLDTSVYLTFDELLLDVITVLGRKEKMLSIKEVRTSFDVKAGHSIPIVKVENSYREKTQELWHSDLTLVILEVQTSVCLEFSYDERRHTVDAVKILESCMGYLQTILSEVHTD